MLGRLTRVAIKNYRSIASCDVALHPLTLLVGPNGSGKSNFLDAFRFLVHSMHAPLEQVVEARSGLRSILRKMPKGVMATRFSIEVEFHLGEAGLGNYLLSIADLGDSSVVLEHERCTVGKHWFRFQNGSFEHNSATKPAFTGDRPALVAMGSLPQFAPVFELLAGMTFYAPNPDRMRKPSGKGAGKVLTRDGSNAADVMARLERTSEDVVKRIRGYLRSFNPQFGDVTVTETDEHRWLAFRPAGNPSNWRLNSSDVSDGTLRAIAILLAVFQASASGHRLSLVGLEEPESNLHPAAAGVLLDALLEASAQVPIMASTHSADLLDRKDLPLESLLAVSMVDGATVIGPVDEATRSILQRRLFTAGELMRSNELLPETSTAPQP